MRTRIIVSGLRDEDAALTCVDCGVDAVGLHFSKASPRFIEPAEAYELIAALPPLIASIAIFDNPDPDDFSDAEETCPTIYTRFVGRESEKLVKACGPDIIKDIDADAPDLAAQFQTWDNAEDVAAIMLRLSPDTGREVWKVAAELADHLHKPLMLAGLPLELVGEAMETLSPFAIDVQEAAESAPGVMDAAKLEAFCRAVRAADNRSSNGC